MLLMSSSYKEILMVIWNPDYVFSILRSEQFNSNSVKPITPIKKWFFLPHSTLSWNLSLTEIFNLQGRATKLHYYGPMWLIYVRSAINHNNNNMPTNPQWVTTLPLLTQKLKCLIGHYFCWILLGFCRLIPLNWFPINLWWNSTPFWCK